MGMTWLAAAAAAAPALTSFLQPSQNPSVTEQDIGSISRQRIGQETQQEQLMALLQGGLANQGMWQATQDQRLTGQGGLLDAQRLAMGEIGMPAKRRIAQQSMTGLNEAYQAAIGQSMEHANRMGVPLSSMQQGMQANLMQPALVQSMQMRNQLTNEELQRQENMRNQIQQNTMAMQNMPALQRLLQIRMAESSRADYNWARDPNEMDAYRWAMTGGVDPNTGLLSNWGQAGEGQGSVPENMLTGWGQQGDWRNLQSGQITAGTPGVPPQGILPLQPGMNTNFGPGNVTPLMGPQQRYGAQQQLQGMGGYSPYWQGGNT